MDALSPESRCLLEAAWASGPSDTQQIEAAETMLGVVFPPSYRAFLATYGAVLGDGFEIAGLTPPHGDGPPQWCDMLSSTLALRPHHLPHDSIFIATNGAGVDYCLSCSRTDSLYEGVVFEWGAGHDGGSIHARNFTVFLDMSLGDCTRALASV